MSKYNLGGAGSKMFDDGTFVLHALRLVDESGEYTVFDTDEVTQISANGLMSNNALFCSKNSVALGESTQAGRKNFKILGMYNNTNNTLILDSVEGITEGDQFTIALNANYVLDPEINPWLVVAVSTINTVNNTVTLTNTIDIEYLESAAPLTEYSLIPTDVTSNIGTTSDIITNTFASGYACKALGYASFATGYATTASGHGAHAEGVGTTAFGNYSHAEGNHTTASGTSSHAEGSATTALVETAHSEGHLSKALGTASHVEGKETQAGIAGYRVYDDDDTSAINKQYHLSSIKNLSVGNYVSMAYGEFPDYVTYENNFGKITAIDANKNIITVDNFFMWDTSAYDNPQVYIFALNNPTAGDTGVKGHYAHAEGAYTNASGYAAHAEGTGTTASGNTSHSEGRGTIASGDCSHAEGDSMDVAASGHASHVEGCFTNASGYAAHAEGYNSHASGESSHAEGSYTVASGKSSHAEGNSDELFGGLTTAAGDASHAEGVANTASGDGSHVEGYHNLASGRYQHVQGKYNIEDTANKYAHIVGNGTAGYDESAGAYVTTRSNAHTLDWDGNAWFAGTVTCTNTIIKSSTAGSTKLFKITVDDSGTLSAVEYTV